ncbi:hypothetical protein NEOLEDRAFT_1223900 [Neolentinus lepideus HHB14362 ss-1]|uniref:G domain-containing protein n=1 Tax=Neolentinus lepideus HHB14362 ss-1 TaxID=1314782 RepID=A0A165PM25_9AGAM|nr:hypothetical protein NEOLEDRAFT_1223900 [Neolentinus lepideus HHB14362 ss-1]
MEGNNTSTLSDSEYRGGALDVERMHAECPVFRILIIGKANAGKTTILRKVCNVSKKTKPVVYDAHGNKRGKHDIEHEITYPGSRFIFHDSGGFEAGHSEELEKVRSFTQKKALEPAIKDQLHLIWYCLPLDDQRPLSSAELAFFDVDTGNVPVVAVFTKFDALEKKTFTELHQQGLTRTEAQTRYSQHAQKYFEDTLLPLVMKAKAPPRTFIYMDQATSKCPELTSKSADALKDKAGLQHLFVITQKNNLVLRWLYAF